jgi:hypothetical protein
MCRGSCRSAAGRKEEGRRCRMSPATQGGEEEEEEEDEEEEEEEEEEDEDEEHWSAAAALGGKGPRYSPPWTPVAGLPTSQDQWSSTSTDETNQMGTMDDGVEVETRQQPATQPG